MAFAIVKVIVIHFGPFDLQS